MKTVSVAETSKHNCFFFKGHERFSALSSSCTFRYCSAGTQNSIKGLCTTVVHSLIKCDLSALCARSILWRSTRKRDVRRPPTAVGRLCSCNNKTTLPSCSHASNLGVLAECGVVQVRSRRCSGFKIQDYFIIS